MEPLYQLRNLVRTRGAGAEAFSLTIPQLSVGRGEKIAVIGASGCGKSTLLEVLGLASRPSKSDSFLFGSGAGQISIAALWQAGDHEKLASLRKSQLGYIAQTGALIPFLSVFDNIAVSLRAMGRDDRGAVESLAAQVGIERHLRKLPRELSVGERQRVAIARALVHRPEVVFADEPTSALDVLNSGRVLKLFLDLVDTRGTAVVMATHDSDRVANLGFRQLQHSIEVVAGGGVRSYFRD